MAKILIQHQPSQETLRGLGKLDGLRLPSMPDRAEVNHAGLAVDPGFLVEQLALRVPCRA